LPKYKQGKRGMLKKRRFRRPIALILVILGGLLMYMAAGEGIGLVLLVSGVALELTGVALERKV
jgi:hypothetical protein